MGASEQLKKKKKWKMLTKSLSKDGGKIKSLQRDCPFQRAITDACSEHILMSSILIVRFCENN